MKNIIMALCLIMALIACNPEFEGFVGFSDNQIEQMLSNGDSTIWQPYPYDLGYSSIVFHSDLNYEISSTDALICSGTWKALQYKNTSPSDTIAFYREYPSIDTFHYIIQSITAEQFIWKSEDDDSSTYLKQQ